MNKKDLSSIVILVLLLLLYLMVILGGLLSFSMYIIGLVKLFGMFIWLSWSGIGLFFVGGCFLQVTSYIGMKLVINYWNKLTKEGYYNLAVKDL